VPRLAVRARCRLPSFIAPLGRGRPDARADPAWTSYASPSVQELPTTTHFTARIIQSGITWGTAVAHVDAEKQQRNLWMVEHGMSAAASIMACNGREALAFLFVYSRSRSKQAL